MLLIFFFLCDVFFVLFVFILCLVPNVTCVSVLTLPEHMSSPPLFNLICVARSLVFCVVFCRSLFVLFFWVIMLSVLRRFTYSDYLFGIFKHFYSFWYSLTFIKTYPIVLWISQQTLKFTINPYLPIVGIQLKTGRFLVVSLSWHHNTDRMQYFRNNLHMLLDVHSWQITCISPCFYNAYISSSP